MQLGTGLFTAQQRPDDDREPGELYDELVEITRTIEDSGLDSAWVSEHHFMEDGYLSGTMPTLGAMAVPPLLLWVFSSVSRPVPGRWPLSST